MSIAPTLQRYLADQNANYDVVPHEPTMSSMRTAEACHIPGDQIAKGIVLRDREGYMLAVLPASHHIHMPELEAELGRHVDLAAEQEFEPLFRDCERGAVPALGACYGLDVIVDDRVEQQPQVYFEAGDHETLVRMSREEFARLTARARHGRFSSQN
jgi:Ala-tRNA(Pro) deacylase